MPRHVLTVFFLPTAIEAEKEKNKFLNGIENFDPTKLKHTETCEKNPLPTKDVIEQEKTAWTSSFNIHPQLYLASIARILNSI